MRQHGKAALAVTPGSPFARMARVFVREWSLPVTEVEQPFPPSQDVFDHNPLGQVPFLSTGEDTVFPTFLILERLWDMAGRPAAAYDPERDRQLLLTILQAGDALVAALYQGWAGLERVGRDHIGYDPAERHLARFERTLDWAEPRLVSGVEAVTLPAVSIACLLLWSDARGGPSWRRHRTLASCVAALDGRPSFAETRPQVWRPD
jgi:glutathione S-transferase